MIKIDRNNLDSISQDYLKHLKEWLFFNEKYKNKNHKDRILKITSAANVDGKYSEMLNFVHSEFDSIITTNSIDGFDKMVKKFSKKFKKEIPQHSNNKGTDSFVMFKEKMTDFYEDFFQALNSNIQYKNCSNAEWLLKFLNVKICPYCNRQYTFTIKKVNNIGGKLIRPEFDHYYPKSKYPYLALSFYNLIPSCPVCNHTKLEEHVDVYPYTDSFQNKKCHFIIMTKDGKTNSLDWALEKDIKIAFTDTNKNIDVFALKELYNQHIDYVEEIIDKTQAYNHSYYNSLIDSYRGLGKEEIEIDRFIWGNYLENAEHEKRPLSKLTKDILEQLKIK